MMLYVFKFDIHADRADEYAKWTQATLPHLIATPGLVELRAYRPVTGSSQVVVTFEFADMAAWTAWWGNAEVQKVFAEGRAYQMNRTAELWGPSPVLPAPMRAQP